VPTLFQGICSRCGHKTPIMLDGYGAVLVDQPATQEQHEVAGAVITSGDGGAMALTSDPQFVELSPLCMSSILASTGYSWSDLLWQGRYVAVTNVICRQCGTVFQRSRLAPPGGTGCMTGLAVGVASGVAVGVWRRSFDAGLHVWCAVTWWVVAVAEFLARLYVRLRFSERAASLAAERACPHCHADDARAFDRAKAVKCPACSTESLRFVVPGYRI
jgi:hypothetical protein